jgi:hypothetical protein
MLQAQVLKERRSSRDAQCILLKKKKIPSPDGIMMLVSTQAKNDPIKKEMRQGDG